ncbi:MAG: group I intron-associated PD-(D/E)XK endonuclease [Candidatus Sulfotelmatobacter sp.]
MSKRPVKPSSNQKSSQPNQAKNSETAPKKSRSPNRKSPNQQSNPPDNPLRPNTKRTGERSEAAFLYQASQRRFAICKPWGDSERYDFILDNRPQPEVHLFRIQVKCTDAIRAAAYETRATYSVGRRHVPYTKRDIDFIAAHVVPLNVWYIIPVEICTPQPMLRFYPHRQAEKMRLEIYREAWHQLDPPLTIQACADPDYPEEDYLDSYVPPTEP